MRYRLCNFAAPLFIFLPLCRCSFIVSYFFLILPESLSVTLLRSVPQASTMLYDCVIYCTTYIAHHSHKITDFR